MKVYDLTHDLQDGLNAFPGDPPCRITTAHAYENGYFVSKISMCTHTGTHIDTPVHRIQGGKSISGFGVDAFIAERCRVIDCRDHDGEIDSAFLTAHAEEIRGCDGILFRSGWEKNWGSDAFYCDFPGISEDAAQTLKGFGVRMVGIETPSVNSARHDTVHEALLKEEIIIVEAVCGMEQLEGTFEFHAVPLKLKERDGSPVRAYAIQRG